MSEKVTNHSLKLNCEQTHWPKATSLDTSIKLAGEEAKDRLYERKYKKKLVRVLTVVAYVFFVSLAAIMLSLYYVFLWKGYPKEIKNAAAAEAPPCRYRDEKFNKVPEPPTEIYDMYTTNSIVTSTEDNLIGINDELDDPGINISPLDIRNNLFYRKYLYDKLVMS